ncbi:hypothetical protein EGI31_13720 [Lacihabitans soyangensis]|uniref:Uncharacterized protein n=2 Tax=Lacihabitans soyangensis TaxID=869394 RepID=A0AAE3H4U2_9BACT|nr:hypothetical protein [Lacihabitans soyangensis]
MAKFGHIIVLVFSQKQIEFMKNQKSTLLAAGFMFFGLFACNSEESTEQTTIVENTATATAPVDSSSDFPPLSSIPESSSIPTATIPPPTGLNPGGQLASSSAPLNTNFNPNVSLAQASVPVKTAAATKGTARLNPAHGQPGHDCAIPVGAPLKNSVASAPAPAKAVAQPIPVETKAVAAPAAAPAVAGPNFNANPNVKINPAHGQPGHDCAVAVGAPLPVK